MINDDKLKKFAIDLSQLTFDMQKICNTKETFFCKSINLTPIEFRCLRYLLNNNFLQVKELAKNMDLTPSRITNLLNSLENKGYVIRAISENDRRIIKIALTSEGEKFAIQVSDKYIQFHKDMLSSISDDAKIENMLENLEEFQKTLKGFLASRS